MPWFQSLSDDQIALLGCAGALLVSGTLMSLSYYIGRMRRGGSNRANSQHGDVLPLTHRGSERPDAEDERKKAA